MVRIGLLAEVGADDAAAAELRHGVATELHVRGGGTERRDARSAFGEDVIALNNVSSVRYRTGFVPGFRIDGNVTIIDQWPDADDFRPPRFMRVRVLWWRLNHRA